jgi:hypothetical protein
MCGASKWIGLNYSMQFRSTTSANPCIRNTVPKSNTGCGKEDAVMLEHRITITRLTQFGESGRPVPKIRRAVFNCDCSLRDIREQPKFGVLWLEEICDY